MQIYTTSRISENILSTPEGYLLCVGVSIARTGEMIYGAEELPIDPDDEGKVVIVRESREVFRPETIKSFEGKPVTIRHPGTRSGDDSILVKPETWSELANGIMQNVRRGQGETENDLVADLLITSARAIQLVKAGLREVSCGYVCDYYQTGVGRGEQRNIVGNHLALVSEGRAGASYAINDHNGKGLKMKLADKIKAIFKKAEEDALKHVATGDEAAPALEAEAGAAGSGYNELKKMVADMGSKIDAMSKPAAKDASSQPTENAPAEVKAKDEAPAAASMEDRMKKLEEMVAGLMKAPAADEDVEMEETEDALEDEDDGEEVEDAAAEEEKEEKGKKAAAGDSAGPEVEEGDEDEEELSSRAEILAPGIKKDQKNLKTKAIRKAYETTDGKAVIDTFTGGSLPDLTNKKFVDAVFIGASEILKVKRTANFAKVKTVDSFRTNETPKGAKSAEEINELNAKHYAAKQ